MHFSERSNSNFEMSSFIALFVPEKRIAMFFKEHFGNKELYENDFNKRKDQLNHPKYGNITVLVFGEA